MNMLCRLHADRKDKKEDRGLAGLIKIRRVFGVALGLVVLGCGGIANASSWSLNTQSWHSSNRGHPVVQHTYARVRINNSADGFVGSWRNVDRNTRGLTRIDIARSGRLYRVHAWGRCHPRDCDWGSATAVSYNANVSSPKLAALSVSFRQSSGTVTLLLHKTGMRITANIMQAFDPRHAAGRKNYFMLAMLSKSSSTAQVGSGSYTPPKTTPPSNSGSSSSASAPTGAQARFRVIITGFTVNEQTWDDFTNSDGKGDEDFLLTHVAELNSRGGSVISSDVRSRVMGDTNGWRGRVHAGTDTHGAGPAGGLETGDQYPSSRPWQLRGRVYDDRAPELVWQGTLRQNDGGVLIAPTIWEWDQAGGDMLLRDWSAVELKLNKLAGSLLNTVSGGATKPFVEGDKALWGLLQSNELARALGHAATRPIGLQEDSKGHQKFQPTIIKLTYDTAEQIIKSNFGKGNGVLEIQYRDSTRLRGDYTIYVKVQKI